MKKIIFVLFWLLISIAGIAQNKSFVFVFLNNKPDKEVLTKEKSDSIMQGHMDNIGRLAKEGKLQAAGPFEAGGGIFVLNTSSVKEANEWLATDPGVQAKRWNIELFLYTPRVGSVCAVSENFEMVFYQFVRFTPSPGLKKESLKQHTDFLQKLSKDPIVIHAGTFGESAGDVFILKAEATKEVIEADPEVRAGHVSFEMKKLYIAKGSFCEK